VFSLLLATVPMSGPPPVADDDVDVAVAVAWAWKIPQQTPPVVVTDPYGFLDYQDFYDRIKQGYRGVLVVGTPDNFVGTYVLHCRVATGFEGLANGEYDYWMDGGQMVRLPRQQEVSRPAVKKPDSSPAVSGVVTTAPYATDSNWKFPATDSPGVITTPAVTRTVTTRPVYTLTGGIVISNCAPSG